MKWGTVACIRRAGLGVEGGGDGAVRSTTVVREGWGKVFKEREREKRILKMMAI